MQQAAFFRCRQHRDRARRAGGAKVRAFQRIDRDIDLRNLAAVRIRAAHLLADIKHGRFVALALADHDGAVHRDRVHRLAHGFGGHLVAQRTVALAHGARRRDGRVLHHAQKFQRQIAFNVFPKILRVRFGTSLGWLINAS